MASFLSLTPPNSIQGYQLIGWNLGPIRSLQKCRLICDFTPKPLIFSNSLTHHNMIKNLKLAIPIKIDIKPNFISLISITSIYHKNVVRRKRFQFKGQVELLAGKIKNLSSCRLQRSASTFEVFLTRSILVC